LIAFGVAAKPVALGHLRVGEDRGGWITLRYARHLDNPGAKAAAIAGAHRRPAARRSR
jgi:hypothetical protein